MDEVKLRDGQLEKEEADIKELFEQMSKSSEAKKQKDIEDIRERLETYKLALEAMHLGIADLESEEKKAYKKKFKAYKKQMKDWQNELEWKQKGAVQDELFRKGDGTMAGPNGPTDVTPGGMMSYGRGLMDENKQALGRIAGVVDETRKVGAATAIAIDRQNATLGELIDKLDSIEGTLTRANKVVKRIARRMAGDKYLWVVIFLVVGGIIAAIVVAKRG